MRRRTVRAIFIFAVLSVAPLAPHVHAQDKEVEKHLRDEYQGKTLVLRGFYSGDRLRYDSTGPLRGRVDSLDWTGNGFVQVEALHFSHHRLMIKARRLLVIQLDGKEFQFLHEDKGDRRKLQIEAELDADKLSPEQVDEAMAKIFLTTQDDMSSLVSDYWKPCVLAALSRQNTFSFSPEILAVPGMAAAKSTIAAPVTAKKSTDCSTLRTNSKGVRPPRAIYSPEPEFSDHARRARFQGVVILTFVVNQKGIPENVRIIRPLGMGLDEMALACVETWRFEPGVENGERVSTQIAVEVEFHLY